MPCRSKGAACMILNGRSWVTKSITFIFSPRLVMKQDHHIMTHLLGLVCTVHTRFVRLSRSILPVFISVELSL